MNAERINGHYDIFGESYLSVTTILGRLKQYGLDEWPIKRAVEYMMTEIVRPLQKGWLTLDQLHETDVEAMAAKAVDQAEREKVDAIKIGHATHRAINQYFTEGQDPAILSQASVRNQSVHRCLLAFRVFKETYKVRPIESEGTTFSVKHRYAGTFDLDAYVTLPGYDVELRALIDFKTGAARSDQVMQLAAYVEAREEVLGVQYDIAMRVRLDAEAKTAKVSIYKRHELRAPFQMFLAIKNFCELEEREKEG